MFVTVPEATGGQMDSFRLMVQGIQSTRGGEGVALREGVAAEEVCGGESVRCDLLTS